MPAKISLIDEDSGGPAKPNKSPEGTIRIDEGSAVRVYRIPDKMHAVVAEQDGNITELGVHDASVSREYDDSGQPGYLEFGQEDKKIYVHNTGASWSVTRKTLESSVEIENGSKHIIPDDSIIEAGHNTKLLVEVLEDRESREDGSIVKITERADTIKGFSANAEVRELEDQLEGLKTQMRTAEISGSQHEEHIEAVAANIKWCENNRFHETGSQAGEPKLVSDEADFLQDLQKELEAIRQFYESHR